MKNDRCTRHPALFPILLMMVSDFALFHLSFLLAFGTFCVFFNDTGVPVLLSRVENYSVLQVVAGGGWLVWSGLIRQHYACRHGGRQESGDIIRALSVCLSAGSLLLVMSGSPLLARTWCCGCGFALILLPLFRALNRYLLNRWGA